ncbi:hypothetical protein ACTG9Q_18870 [Actinokineospora sp. 24-640]
MNGLALSNAFDRKAGREPRLVPAAERPDAAPGCGASARLHSDGPHPDGLPPVNAAITAADPAASAQLPGAALPCAR